MAWQTPKTNWSAADGVRDSDFNRIEGNLFELYNTGKLRADITVYVSTSGSDTTGDGSNSAPYATINKALSILPKDLNGKSAIISVAAGTYLETVNISGFSGLVSITGIYGQRITVLGMTVDACSCFLQGATFSFADTGLTVTNGATLMSSSQLSFVDNNNAITVTRGSTCIIDASLSISGASIGVYARYGSRVYILQLTISDSAAAIQSENGSIVAYASTNMNVNALAFITRSGGRIVTGAQTSLPNY